MNEFELINAYFMHSGANGDDAALIDPAPGHSLVTSVDTLVEDRHFRATACAYDIGYKSLAVSISDIAAMGAKPTAFLLSLSLPVLDELWVKQFSDGLYAIAKQFNVEHIGGDLTRGPLVISSIVFGEVPQGQALQRNGAQVNDDIYVSGHLGDAAAALHNTSLDQTRLNRPLPRVVLGMALRRIANSCIDISDGLAQDLQHILTTSGVGAQLIEPTIPYHSSLDLALTGGDDYELCFTAAIEHRTTIDNLAQQLQLPLTRIGTIMADQQLTILDANHSPLKLNLDGYQHF